MAYTQGTGSPPLVHSGPRKVVRRTRGISHGPITRLMSPGDLGQVLKPFVFLDLFDLGRSSFPDLGLHPHSGIATVTYLFEGGVRYEDSNGATGVLPAGGVEWFKAAHGAWHGGGPGNANRTRGFQLWLALPPDHELGPVDDIYQAPDTVRAMVQREWLLGSHGRATSSLQAPGSINYLAVRLGGGIVGLYQPPSDHTIGWVAAASGRVRVPERVEGGSWRSSSPRAARSKSGRRPTPSSSSGRRLHPHDLVLGRYSVHTSRASLHAAEQRIREIQHRLQRERRL